MLMMMETGPEIIDIRLAPQGKGGGGRRKKRGGGELQLWMRVFLPSEEGGKKCACMQESIFI